MNGRIKGRVGTVWGKWERGKDFGKWVKGKRQKGKFAKCSIMLSVFVLLSIFRYSD
jgi:hypothetical protein